MPKFSIIIPIYNSYSLLEKCLKSLENQTCKDFEIIFIDDCSTDDSFQELKKYSEESNLSIICVQNDKNLGPGKTRNRGIEIANGRYVIFIDSDDYIENNTFEIMNKIIDETDVDCIIFDYYHHTDAGTFKRKSLLNGKPGIINKSDAIVYSSTNSWGKVYLLKNIIENDIRFPDFKRNEDMPFNKLVVAASNKIYYCNENLYNYINNKKSLMHNHLLTDENNAINGFEIIYNNLYEKYPKEVEAIFLKHYLYATTVTLITKGIKNSDLKVYVEKCERRFPRVYENEMLNNMSEFQKTWIFCLKGRLFVFLRILANIRKILKNF